MSFETRIKRLVHSVLSKESITHTAFAAQISTPTDCVSKQTVGQWLGTSKGIGWERFNRITDWLERHGYPVTIPPVEEEKSD